MVVSGDAEAAVLQALGTDQAPVVATTDPVTAFDDLAEALSAALHTADVAARMPDSGATRVWRPRDLGARGLVWRLREDRHLLAYVDDQPGAVLRLDDEKRFRAWETLRAFVEADGAMTEFADRIGTSRPSAYASLRWLSDVLQRELDGPHNRLSAYLALLALEQLESSPVTAVVTAGTGRWCHSGDIGFGSVVAAAAAVTELLAEFLGTSEWSEVLPGVAQIAPQVLPIVVEALYGQHPG